MPDYSTLRNFVELIHHVHGLGVLHVGLAIGRSLVWTVAAAEVHPDTVRMKMQHQRSLHLARVPQSAELRLASLLDARGGEHPVRRIGHMDTLGFHFA